MMPLLILGGRRRKEDGGFWA